MQLGDYFVLPDGRLRAGWRLLLFGVFFFASLIVFAGAASPFFQRQSLASQAAVLAATTVSATWLMMRLLERQPLWAVGLMLEEQSWQEMRLGLIGGMGMVGGITLTAWAGGTIEFQPSGTGAGPALGGLVSITVILAVSAANEELLFRGYPFQRLAEGVHGYFALAASSLLFGLLHAHNPHATSLSSLNTVLAGVLLSLAYLKTRALWLPIGFHFSWNWAQMLVALPVSGLDVGQMPWQAIPSSNYAWLHGGSYGPEGGLLATAGLTVGVVYLALRQKKFPPLERETSAPLSDAGGSS